MKKRTTNRTSPLRWILLAAFLCIVAVGAYFVHRHYEKPIAKTTSKAVTAQSNYSSGNNRPTSSSNDASQGGAIDQQGKTTPTSTTQSQWATSGSGNITLENPIARAILTSNDTIEGTAKVATVQYRLVDAQVGVVAQGSLNVVKGSFAGKIQFQHTAAAGQLDIFSYNAQGNETDSITIPVSFAQ